MKIHDAVLSQAELEYMTWPDMTRDEVRELTMALFYEGVPFETQKIKTVNPDYKVRSLHQIFAGEKKQPKYLVHRAVGYYFSGHRIFIEQDFSCWKSNFGGLWESTTLQSWFTAAAGKKLKAWRERNDG